MSARRLVLGVLAGCSSQAAEQPPPPPVVIAVVTPDAMSPIAGPPAPTSAQREEAARQQLDAGPPAEEEDTLLMLRRRGPYVALGDANAQGALDKEIIRRVVRRNVLKVQYCYEKELLVKPSLQGRMAVQFTIGRDGNVEDVRATGVDPEVAACVAAVVRMIEFPEPTDGVVHVSYPFTFEPAP